MVSSVEELLKDAIRAVIGDRILGYEAVIDQEWHLIGGDGVANASDERNWTQSH